MAIYENKEINELVIYGSSRLGSYNAKTETGKRTLGNKKYELSNHLGNVLSVISDNKIGIDSDTDLVADSYKPLIISESDYYPFGMAMKERSFSNEEYRFGFNTQEKSTEIGKDTYTAEFWQYDSKIARRWNIDPVNKIHESSYAVFAGNPIWFIDLNGADTSVYDKGYEKELVDGSDWVWKPVPTKTLEGGDDVFLLEHEDGTIELGGKKYIQLWSEYSLWGNDYDLNSGQGTDGILINNFMAALNELLKKENVINYTEAQLQNASSIQGRKAEARGRTVDRTDYSEAGTQGKLDIAYNGFLMFFTEEQGGTVSDSLPNSLFLIGGKYANGNEAGNYAIGYAAGYSGNAATSIPILAHIFSFLQGEWYDDPHKRNILKHGIKDGAFHRNTLILQSSRGWTPYGYNKNWKMELEQSLKSLELRLQGK